jgi:hypothetical protein
VVPGSPGRREVRVGGEVLVVETSADAVVASGPDGSWRLQVGDRTVASAAGAARIALPVDGGPSAP